MGGWWRIMLKEEMLHEHDRHYPWSSGQPGNPLNSQEASDRCMVSEYAAQGHREGLLKNGKPHNDEGV